MKTLATLTLLITALSAATYSAHATVIYNYTGNNFTSVVSPFSTSDSLTGFVEFASAPDAGGETDKTDVIDYSFTAGPLTLTTITAPFSDFTFNFDSNGDITGWDVAMLSDTLAPRRPRIRTCTNTGNQSAIETFVGCTVGGTYDEAVTASVLSFERAAIQADPGTWTAAAVVPIPAALWLFGSGLLGLIGVARRKVRV